MSFEVKKSLSKFRSILRHYWIGSKLTIEKWKTSRVIKAKCTGDIASENSRSPIEQILVNQYRYDMAVGLPLLGLFALPVVGYTVPLLSLVADRYFPSSLITADRMVRCCESNVCRDQEFALPFLRESSSKKTDRHRTRSSIRCSR